MKKRLLQLTIITSTLTILLTGCANEKQEPATDHVADATADFKGSIDIDIRKSKSDWDYFMPKQAKEDAPNILFVLIDDMGVGASSTYGGMINMPTMDAVAAEGLTYSQFNTPAVCSPMRSTILTGRNHHLNGYASISEGAAGFPGQSGFIPESCAPISKILQDNGYSTFWLGKNHNVSVLDVAPGASRKSWPLGMGFDRFYGFLGGETNQWYPDLVEDNHYLEVPPYTPEEGYHLSKDLADKAIKYLRDQNVSNPSKPWYMWFCPGAGHAPHQAPQEYIDKYKGKFDDGYEAYRDWVVKRMKEKQILPENTENTPINPLDKDIALKTHMVRPWNSLSDDEKQLFARMAEVYAGFCEYTDAQIGRVIDYLKETGQYENTVIIWAADNGASGEGSPNGSVNENRFFNSYPDDLAENIKNIDKLGSVDTYNHYPTGWAVAFSGPLKMFKQYSLNGGTNVPLVISWPKGIQAKGEIRNQYHHSVDIAPTILELAGLEFPEVYEGIKQTPLSGTSMTYSFDSKPDAPSEKHTQYYAMLGTRAIWYDGWKAVAKHTPLSGLSHFEDDQWALYHTDVDRSESEDLAAQEPEKLKELVALWFEEANQNNVLPLDDRTVTEIVQDGIKNPAPSTEPHRETRVYYPFGDPISERSGALDIRNRNYKILADVVLTEKTSGVIYAHGSRFGVHSLFIKDGNLYYVYNFIGITEQKLVSNVNLTPGQHILGVEFVKEGNGKYKEATGTMKLYIDDQVVAEGPMKTQIGSFSLSGEGICIGYDGGDAVSKIYTSPARFSNGKLKQVTVSVEGKPYHDIEMEMQKAWASQ